MYEHGCCVGILLAATNHTSNFVVYLQRARDIGEVSVKYVLSNHCGCQVVDDTTLVLYSTGFVC